jgi:signal peptidase I
VTTSIRAPVERIALSYAAVLAIAAIGTALFWSQIQAPSVVAGHSMEPTLLPGDRILVDRWSYRHRPPAPGEVVVLHRPGGPEIVKRVARGIAIRSSSPPDPDPSFLVLGDNAPESEDSRQFGPVRTSDLAGRVSWCYWPPARFGPIPSARR